MSRRTDVLNKYPAPRVSVVNQSIRPFAGFAGVLLTTKTRTTKTTTTTMARIRAGSSSINQSADKRAAGIFTIGRGARLARRRRWRQGKLQRSRVNYDQKTLNRYWLRTAHFYFIFIYSYRHRSPLSLQVSAEVDASLYRPRNVFDFPRELVVGPRSFRNTNVFSNKNSNMIIITYW